MSAFDDLGTAVYVIGVRAAAVIVLVQLGPFLDRQAQRAA